MLQQSRHWATPIPDTHPSTDVATRLALPHDNDQHLPMQRVLANNHRYMQRVQTSIVLGNRVALNAIVPHHANTELWHHTFVHEFVIQPVLRHGIGVPEVLSQPDYHTIVAFV